MRAEAISSPHVSKYVEPGRITPEVKAFIEQQQVASVPVQKHNQLYDLHEVVVDKKQSVTDEQKAVGAMEDAKPKAKMVPSNCVRIRFLKYYKLIDFYGRIN